MDQGYRLSPQQRRLWLCREAFGFQAAQISLQIQGDVDKGMLKKALYTVIGQYEVFKTQFVTVAGMNVPLQVVEKNAIEWIEWDSGQHVNESADGVSDILQQLSARTQENTNDPQAVVATLIQLAEKRCLLIINFHAMTVDHRSMELVAKKIFKYYEDFLRGKAAEDEEELSYIDASDWSNDILESEESKGGKRFWTNTHFDALAQNRSSLGVTKKEILFSGFLSTPMRALDPKITRQLVEFAARKRVSVADALLACLQAILYRHEIGHQSVIGVHFGGRSDDELETVIGPLGRFLPVTCNINRDTTLGDLSLANKNFKDMAGELQEYFDWQVLADNTSQGFFPYCFELFERGQYIHDESIQVACYSIDYAFEPAQLKLSVSYCSATHHIDYRFYFNESAISPNAVNRLSDYFEKIIASAMENPDATINQLDMLNDRHRHALISIFNSTERAYDLTKTIIELFDAQAQKTPSATALESGNASLSYAESVNKINLLAQHIVASGILPGEFVGVYTQHSMESVLSILAIFKAGAVYVPLDPSYPQERIQYILQDSDVKTILTQKRFDTFFKGTNYRVIIVDARIEQAITAQLPTVLPEDNAYLIYTSGSTGTPKGTLINHRALANHCYGICDAYQLTAKDRVLLFAPLNFDPSLEQSLPPLISGATVVVREPDIWNVTEVARRIVDLQLTVVNFPTAFWHVLVQEWERESYNPQQGILRMMICGGDKMLLEMVRRWNGLGLENVVLVNAYGPTETTVTATIATNFNCFQFEHLDIPIGRPLANRKIYILDDLLRPVPIGCSGDLYIAGESLSSGYLNREQLTSDCFLVDPFSSRDDARMYKTGDRALFGEAGDIYFLGRQDSQIKINGFRVEVSEVESALAQVDGVVESAVGIKTVGDDEKWMVAFFVSDETEVTGDYIREAMAERVPLYMVPQYIVCVESLPLLPNGKLDKKAIKAMSQEYQADQDVDFVAPVSVTEKRLAEIWAQVFKLEKVSMLDSFFKLRGHSLSGMKILSCVRNVFSVELTLSDVFDSIDIRAMAQVIDNKQRDTADCSKPPIIALNCKRDIPLSSAQERLWFLAEMGQSALYNMPGLVRINGLLNRELLKKAVSLVINRHASLRTCFSHEYGVVKQHIIDNVPFEIEEEDFSDLSSQGAEEQWQLSFRRWTKCAFNLANAPLVRVKVMTLHDKTCLLGFCIHHIIADGLSIGILIRDISRAYGALAENCEPEFPKLQVNYADYSQWLQHEKNIQSREKGLHYLSSKLSGYQNLELKTDKRRPKIFTGKGALLKIEFDRKTVSDFVACCNNYGVTLFAGLTAVVYMVLSRHSGQNDFCLGMPIANRDENELENVVGVFVNTLVLRLNPELKNLNIKEFLHYVKQQINDARTHQNVPFEQLVESIQPERDLSRNPIFQVFISHIHPEKNITFGILNGEPVIIDTQTSRFDLSFDFEEGSTGDLTLMLEYYSDLFFHSTITRIAEHLKECIKEISRKTSCDEIDFVSLQERGELKLLGCGNQVVVEENLTLNKLFAQQAKNVPNKTAIVYGKESLTYRELDFLSDRLAFSLSEVGIGPGDYVGICVERSIDMVVGLLGILKSGAAYIPLDLDFPEERTRYILENSKVPLVVTQSNCLDLISSYCGDKCRFICIDKQTDVSAIIYKVMPDITGKNIAYTLYTSGSTGNPKGVMISHGSLVNFLLSMEKTPGFAADDSLLAVTTYCFDISILEIFLPLVCGGTCIIASSEINKNAEQLLHAIEQYKPTVMQATPITWSMLFRVGWKNNEKVKILCGGEALGASLQESFIQSHSEVWNMYGPTETTIWSTCHKLTSDSAARIGLPIHNTEVLILDDELRLVPFGAIGQLYIGGLGLAEGYLNQPELTRSRFILNPFDNQQRIYQTGDLVRWAVSETGGKAELEYVGRADFQVKHRGHRIEPGEIEVVLQRNTMVNDACVLIRDYHSGPRLVAYFTSVSGKLMPEKLREWARRSLPEYMVPSNYYQLNELPLTPNGKIDRKELLAIPLEDDGEIQDCVSPLSATERHLCDIWKQLFELTQVSVLENFFELGGHSLLLVMLQARIQESFNKRIAIGDMFNNATVRELAKIVDAAPAANGPQGFTVAGAVPQKWPLSFTQRGLWLVDNMDKGTSAYNMPSAFRLKGMVDPNTLIACFTDIEQRHEVLRTRYVFENGEVFQEILPAALPTVPVIDLSQYSDSEQERRIDEMIEEDFHHRFDLERGYTWRVRIAALNQYELVVFINIHHICTDGWSFRLLINEVKALYSARLAQRSSPLASLDFQYKDYALWQRQQVGTAEYKDHLEFWQSTLRQIPDLSALPRDFEYPRERSYEGQFVDVQINRSLSEKLRLLARNENSTIFVVLLTAYKLLLASETGQLDIVVGTDVANRTSKSAESLIGFFVNQIPLRTFIETDKSISEQIAVIRRGFVEALSHQEVSFDQLINHLNINRSSRYSPLFQTKFFMETIPHSTYDVSEEGMDMEIVTMKRQSARLDLTVGLVDTLDGIDGTMVYNTALFSRSTMERLSEKLTRILEFMVGSSESSARELFESLRNHEKNNKSKKLDSALKRKLDKFKGDSRDRAEISAGS